MQTNFYVRPVKVYLLFSPRTLLTTLRRTQQKLKTTKQDYDHLLRGAALHSPQSVKTPTREDHVPLDPFNISGGDY